MSRLIVPFVLVALMVSTPVLALENENLLTVMPKGYKIASQTKNDRLEMTQLIPSGETADSWTEMVTIQLFLKLGGLPPAEFRARLEKLQADSCPGSTFEKVKDRVENGYRTLTWSQKCPQNMQTGKPEVTMLKGIQGRDSFYLVQKAYRFVPSADQSKIWNTFLDDAQVCDTRLPDRPCRPTQ